MFTRRIAPCLATLALLTACGGPPTTMCSPDAGPCDSGIAQDSGTRTDVTSPDATMMHCGTDGWVTYGHDARRTFATDACITGPLTMAWNYVPTVAAGTTLKAVHHAIATSDAVYLQWAASDGPYVGTTAADRISLTGMRVWTFDSGSDANMADWASLWSGHVILNDDGIYILDQMTGMRTATTGVDWWGQTIPSTSEFYLVNTSKSDGPGLFVAAMGDTAMTSWRQNVQGNMCGQSLADQLGAIALDGTMLFYAADYHTGSSTMPTFPSGLYAFDTTMMGHESWRVAAMPSSAISVGNGLIYGVEGGSALVARHQTDGSMAWTQPVSGAGVQAPVIANSRLIIATNAGIASFDAMTGAPGWNTPLPGAVSRAYSITITNGCGGSQPLGGAVMTTLAAALGSGTLVVTTATEVHVLSLSTGAETWHGMVPGAMGALHDPVVVGHNVYVIDSPAGLVAFGAGQLIALTGM